MSDIVRLLPDSVANQIAAGEVIQRPASAVKELMENAIDAGATTIQLIIKDAGKTLIQVTDNGSGMSETDVRMAFERHATSKIKKAEDLFAIRTMGFRGEALASIAAVAQVEVKSRLHEAVSGTQLFLEGSKVTSQEPCATAPGTAIIARNLFFNIPARRNFLKSNAAETRHIIEEFHRLAIANPDRSFTFFHDGFEVFRLMPGNLRQRLVGLFGAAYNERLVPVEESTTILGLAGYIGKPEFSRKTRGEQYLFVNNRFIRNAYLNHAVTDAFEDLLPSGTFPSYFLFIDIDPARIDINIHPTKTEVKFEDEKSVFAIVRAAVKRALGKFSVTPSLDFEQETAFNIPVAMYDTTPRLPVIKVDTGYNPFREGNESPQRSATPGGWEKLYQAALNRDAPREQNSNTIPEEHQPVTTVVLAQWNRRYIVALRGDALLCIDQQAAHTRVLYERNKAMLEQAPVTSQQELFPKTWTFSHNDALVLEEIADDIRKLGFDIRPFGNNTYVLNAVPAGIPPGQEKETIDHVIESFRNHRELKNDKQENLLRSVARNLAVKNGEPLELSEMQHIADALFACDVPAYDPSGNPVFVSFTPSFIEQKFKP